MKVVSRSEGLVSLKNKPEETGFRRETLCLSCEIQQE